MAYFIAPGWIDLQVNGFAGVDYNSAASSHEQIAHSIRAQFACGVTRFFPTVITGSPENMTAALRNLASAKESIAEGRRAWRRSIWKAPTSLPTMARAARIRPAGCALPISTSSSRFQEAANGNIRLVTLSPEWPQAPQLHRKDCREGRGREHWPHPGFGLSDRRRGQRRRHAIHASRQRRRRRAPPASQLSLGATGRGSPGRQLHRRWIPSAAFVLERRPARQGTGAVAPGHRRSHAGRLPSRPLSSWAKSTSSCTPMAAFAWREARAWPVPRCAWIRPLQTSCGPLVSACAKPSRLPPAIPPASAASPPASAASIPAIVPTWSASASTKPPVDQSSKPSSTATESSSHARQQLVHYPSGFSTATYFKFR